MKNFLIALFALFAIVSCEKEEQFASDSIENKSASFILNGTAYAIEKNEDGTTNTSLLDAKVATILATGYSLEISNSDDIYLFETNEALNEYIEAHVAATVVSDPADTKSLKALAFFYEHHKFIGGSRVGRDAFYFSNLAAAPHNFNDRISSCQIENFSSKIYVVKMYQHSLKRGREHTLIVLPGGSEQITDFAPIGFNDQVSSILGYFL